MLMAINEKQIQVRGLADLRRKLKAKFKKVINNTLRDKALRLKIGKVIEQDIRDNFGGNMSVLASQTTREFREYFEQFNKTHPDYRRPKINITFTGKLLEDLANNVKADTTKLSFIVAHSNKKHPGYKDGGRTFKPRTVQVTSLKTRKTTNRQQKRTYKEIGEFVVDNGYDYLTVSDRAEKIILDLIKKRITDELNKQFAG